MEPDEIETRFTYPSPGDRDRDKERHRRICAEFKRLAHELNEVLPFSREAILTFARLEEAHIWAHIAVARHDHDRH
ncbi:hypothetical protein [Streptomyces radicis]|uniref:Acb2/Tad1 hairpin domain-containing protein n=1 Tax=Streptomyces radicis TaxID=1750517 RepID=A0A3A9WPH1_9ACTN|nr:hypothetical protein [Streptomyces radicis]RKN09656.1 hypothetical protein D7319_11380 [Streptomyces radicis]